MSTDNAVVSQSAPSDTALIAAARRGEPSAFQTLMSRHLHPGARLPPRLPPPPPPPLLRAPRPACRPHRLAAVGRANGGGSKKSGRAGTEQSLSRMLDESSIDRDLLAKADRAYRALPESQQVALGHPEVDGEPLLDTGAL